jgi:GNAT superfamily N-acetyltransferase
MAPIHRLVEATDSEQRARDLLTAQAWGRQLTTEQFLQREAGLRAHPFAKQHLRTWLWVDEAGAVLSSCETFEVPARRGSRLGRAFVIASVFTEPALRGKGHAVTLINAVCERLGQQTDALAVSLFSEVGARIYERAGFVAQPSWDVVLPLETSVLPMVTSSVEEFPAVEAPPSVMADGSVQLELTVEQCDWQVERERLYARALKRPELKTHLLRRGRSSLALTASFQTNELHVLWYRFELPADVGPLLAAAADHGRASGLKALRVWETTPIPLPAGSARVERTDELPMLRSLDGAPARWSFIERGLWA